MPPPFFRCFRAADFGGGRNGFEEYSVIKRFGVGDGGPRLRSPRPVPAADSPARRARVVLHRLEFRDFLFERDALVGIAHGKISQHRFKVAPAICNERATAAHQHQMGLLKNPSAAGLVCDRLYLVERHGVAVIAAEAKTGVDPALGRVNECDRHSPLASPATTAMVLGGLRKRHAAGLARQAAIGIEHDAGPSGLPGRPSFRRRAKERFSPARGNQPASMVSASGTAMAWRPAALRTERSLRRGLRLTRCNPPAPRTAAGRTRSAPARAGAFHAPFLSRLMVWASARSAKIFPPAVSATMFSLLSAHGVPHLDWHGLLAPGAGCFAGLQVQSFLDLCSTFSQPFLALYDAEKP